MRRVPVTIMIKPEAKLLLQRLAEDADLSVSSYLRTILNASFKAKGITQSTVTALLRRAA